MPHGGGGVGALCGCSCCRLRAGCGVAAYHGCTWERPCALVGHSCGGATRPDPMPAVLLVLVRPGEGLGQTGVCLWGGGGGVTLLVVAAARLTTRGLGLLGVH